MDEMNKQIGESEKKKIELNNSPVPVEEETEELDSENLDSENLDGSVNGDSEKLDSTGDSINEDSENLDSNGTDTDNLDGSINEDSTSDMQTDVPAETEAVEEVSVENSDTENSDTEIPSAEKLFTQSQVNDLVGKTRMETREQTYRAIYGRYGVNDEIGMDELVGNAQMYETVKGEYDEAKKGWEETNASRDAELAKVKEHVALLESGIDKSRFDDAKAIIKAKGLEVTAENIQNELATHPEWNGSNNKEDINPNFRPDPNLKPQTTTSPESTIKVLGNEGNSDTGGMSEEEYAMKKLFKL